MPNPITQLFHGRLRRARNPNAMSWPEGSFEATAAERYDELHPEDLDGPRWAYDEPAGVHDTPLLQVGHEGPIPVDAAPWSDLTFDYRDRTHKMESQYCLRRGQGVDYSCVDQQGAHPPVGAHGRYQFTRPAFEDVGLIDAAGNWVRDNHLQIPTYDDFMSQPERQERAMSLLTRKNDDRFTNHLGTYGLAGRTNVVMPNGGRSVVLSQGNILAAAHRHGAAAVREVLNQIAADGGQVIPENHNRKDALPGILDRLDFFEGVKGPWVGA